MSNKESKLEIVQKYYIRKKDGEIDYEHPYDNIKKTNSKGLYCVRLDKQIGYMNEEGEFIVPISYDYTRKNYRGYEEYHVDIWYYYDGKTVISSVYKNNRIGVINSRGEELVPCEFEGVELYSNASENFIPVALPSHNTGKLVWGIYDVKNKRVSATPQYEEMSREKNGYASFKKNGKWGLLHCASGIEVIPAMYLLYMDVSDTGIVRAFLGGKFMCDRSIHVDPEDCHVLVVNGIKPAQLVVSGYKWIEQSGPFVMKCSRYNPKQEDSFKIVKMPNYIGIVKNATYEAGYFLEENGKFVKKRTKECTTYYEIVHARYSSGGIFSAITYDGKSIHVTKRMKLEILERISKE